MSKQPTLETKRLILREIVFDDAEGMYRMDSDPAVHRYLGGKQVTKMQTIYDAINQIRKQYVNNGIGRWAVIEKSSGQFVGWAGLKLIKEMVNGHSLFYDMGYRFAKIHWGKGYATECTMAVRDYAAEILKLDRLYAYIDSRNAASRKVLQKTGFVFVNPFFYEETDCDWFTLNLEELKKKNQGRGLSVLTNFIHWI